ncbi:MAG: RNA methyltransferase, partial [Salinivirgaceae bacterium]|nr:RNA methyltransferase [Salinivirgaceae bacterium]
MTDNKTQSDRYQMIAKTFAGLEDVLAEELAAIGAKNIKRLIRAISFEGDKAMMYKANYYVRTALCILKPIAEFNAKNEDTYYKEIGNINWSDYMTLNETFSINVTTQSQIFSNSLYATQKAKDAIADQFRRR